MTYATELATKAFKPNVVIRFLSEYFSKAQPDSGLTVDADKVGIITSLTINPTEVDIKRVNTTISSYTIRLLDKSNVITGLMAGRGSMFFGQSMEIWIGRITGSFAFADYFKLPVTRIKKIDYENNVYTIQTAEETDRMNKPIYDTVAKLNAGISASDTSIVMNDSIDDFPSTGELKIDTELVTYTAKDNGTKTFSSCTRGANNSIATLHSAGANAHNVVTLTGHPLDLLMQLLISGGGGGTYDVLTDGLGITAALIDTTEIEALRDSIFPGEQFSFKLFNVSNALKFIEDEILLACNVRFKVSASSKISLALLDQSVFGADVEEIDHDTVVSQPKLSVDENDIVNVIYISWDWDEGTQTYKRRSLYQDTDSIADIGERPHYNLAFKGIKASLDGSTIADDRGNRLIERLSSPAPEITLKTQIDKSLINVGDKVLVTSDQIPSSDGTSNFSNVLEVLSRAINQVNGDVTFKLTYTSYIGLRGCYIAPSDVIQTKTSQKVFTVSSGRGAEYKPGWKMRLWKDSTRAYETDPVNEIESIAGDTITMVDNWATTIVTGDHRIRFADYDDASADQHRYGFICEAGTTFPDGSSAYQILF